MPELLGTITYGQLSNIILALGLFAVIIIVSVVTYIAVVEKRK